MISKLTAVANSITSGLAHISSFELLLWSDVADQRNEISSSAPTPPAELREMEHPSSASFKSVSIDNILANSKRRRMIMALAGGCRIQKEIATMAGLDQFEYHLHILESAGLIELEDGLIELTSYGMKTARYLSEEEISRRDVSDIMPVEITGISQLLPCPGDPSMFRVTAMVFPPPRDAIRAMKAVFPRSRYSDRMKALIIPRKRMRITLYSSGNVSAVMLRSMQEAEDALYELRDAINYAARTASRANHRIDHMEINHLLAHTNCGECGEKSCYCFAIKLAEGETTLEMCTPLKEARHSAKTKRLMELLR